MRCGLKRWQVDASALALVLAGIAAFAGTARASQLSFAGIVMGSDPEGKGIPDFGDPYGGKVGYGGGALLELSLAPWIGFETGGLYLQRKFSVAGGQTLNAPVVQVPISLRVWFGSRLSIVFGGYISPAIGPLKPLSGGPDISYPSFGWKTLDYGGLGGARWDFGGAAFIGFFIEGRYSFGIRNLSELGPGTDVRHRDIQGLAGIRFSY